MAYNPIILTGKADPIGVEVAQIPYSGSPDSISIDFNNADWTSEGGADGSLTINDNALWIFYWNATSWIWASGPGTYGGNATPATEDDFQPLGVADSQSHFTQNPDGSWRHCDGDPTSENCVDLISPFNSLSDVDVLGAGPDEILAFNGTHWVPYNPPPRTLDSLDDTDIPSPSDNDVLTYSGTDWIATPETDPVYSASAASGIQPGDINSWNEAYNWGDHAIVGYLTDETDPVYSASAASGIDASDITNWDAAYGWGNHANEGYLKSFDETDPVYSASAASGIDASDITNWDEAYGWGNHASGGYITDITGESIKDLSDVNSGMIPTDSQVLTYDDTNGWQSETPAAANVFYDDTLSGMGVSNVKDAIDSLNLVAAAGAVEWVGNHSDYGVPAGTYPTIHEAVNATDWTGHPHADGTVTTAVYIAVNHIVSFGPGASATIYRWVGPKDVTVGVGGSYTTAESDYVPSGTADHESLTNKGTNTHPQIDTHIADGTLHFTQGDISITESQISDLQPYLLDITGESIANLSDVDDGLTPQHDDYLVYNETVTPAQWMIDGNRVMRWAHDYYNGMTVPKNTAVHDNKWLMISNKETSDVAAPQFQGSAYWVSGLDDAPAWSINNSTTSQLIMGQRYTFQEGLYINAIRFWVDEINPDITYSLWAVSDPEGNAELVSLVEDFPPDESGWYEFRTGEKIAVTNQVIDYVIIKKDTGNNSTFSGDWNYNLPNNATDPGSGEITHANKEQDTLKVHKSDQSGDRSADLAQLNPGDKIANSDVGWEITAITDSGDFYEFRVTPSFRGDNEGVDTFDFTVHGSQSVNYPEIVDHYSADPTVTVNGLFSTTGYDNKIINNNSYGLDILVRKVLLSPDWEFLSLSTIGSVDEPPVVASPKQTVEIDDAEPSNPAHGDLWWSEATGIMAVYNVNTWVQVN